MERMITFRKLKNICFWKEWGRMGGHKAECVHKALPEIVPCTAANCPVWKKLKEVK